MAAPAEADVAVFPVFELELLRTMAETMRKQNELLGQLKDVLLDLRDELALARTERKARGA